MKFISRVKRLLFIGLSIGAICCLTACSIDNSVNSSGISGFYNLTPLNQLDILSNPKNYYGPSSAVLPNASITPIEENPSQTLPVNYTDIQGNEVTITDTSRLLALDIYGSLSAIVYALGLGDLLVGRDVSTGFPEAEDLPLVTVSGHDLSAEAILDLAPTLIITDTSLGPYDVLLQIKEAGIPVVFVTSERNIANVSDLINAVGTVLGVPETAEKLSAQVEKEIQEKIDEIKSIAPESAGDKVRMLFIYTRGSSVAYVFGDGSGIDDLIENLGGIDVASEAGISGTQTIGAETLIDLNPDLVLVMTHGLESHGTVDEFIENMVGLSLTNAGINRRIVDMNDTDILSFGPRTADVLDALARAVYAPDSL